MSHDTPAVQAALKADQVLLHTLLQIELPSYTLRLIDGGAPVVVGGLTFLAEDPTYGTLGSVQGISDGMDAEAPRPTVTINPASAAAAADLANPDFQGSPAICWEVVLDPVTGAVIPTPRPLFVGELDVPVLRVNNGLRVLEFQLASAWETFFEGVDLGTLSDAFHQSIWPGELGLADATGVTAHLNWGVDTPSPSNVTNPANGFDRSSGA